MNFVPTKYRNVINPWQTEKDIGSAIFFIVKMMSAHPNDNWDTILNTNNMQGPDRKW